VSDEVEFERALHINGQLGGYHWGVERKQKLLAHEHAATTAHSSAAETNQQHLRDEPTTSMRKVKP
jgi:hypothetical protein